MKKFNTKSLAMWLVIGVLGVLSLGGAAAALSGYFPVGIETCDNCTLNVESAQQVGEMVGASGTRYPNGISADSTSPSAGEVRGTTLTTTGAASVASLISSGDITGASGALLSTGALVEQETSSTLKIGNDADGLATGCLVLGDSGGTTSTPVYITATGSTITATTTQPAICR